MNPIFPTLLLIILAATCQAQLASSLKVETGYIFNAGPLVDVEPGPGWRGHYLDEINGYDVNIIYSLSWQKKWFGGLGAGYANYEGYHGLAVFSDFEYVHGRKRIRPLINIKAGSTHVWNQYDGGTRSGMGEMCMGVDVRLKNRLSLYFKMGIGVTQQTLLAPLRLGLRL